MSRHSIGTVAALVAGLAAITSTGARPVAQETTAVPMTSTASGSLIAHEWGTFTTVADEQGRPTEWLPLSGQSDLPCFVHYYQNREVKVLTAANLGPLVNYRQARERLRGTVRMETPVIYFYASAETSVDVTVSFPQGLFSEWYPTASVLQQGAYERLLPVAKTVGSYAPCWRTEAVGYHSLKSPCGNETVTSTVVSADA